SDGEQDRWAQHVEWARLRQYDENGQEVKRPGTVLTLGYKVDHLAVAMFLMVTFVATLIHIFSVGYMSEELQDLVEDHQVHTEHGHLHRPGRFVRFFLFLSLFCFSMLTLVLTDNLVQVFVSWELVGICSYLLIGFYFERHSASTAANKAFITNRIGDAGFIVGLLIIWTYVGTFNFDELFARVRAPVHDGHGDVVALGGQFIRADIREEIKSRTEQIVAPEIGKKLITTESGKKLIIAPETGSEGVLFGPQVHVHAEDIAPFEVDEKD